MSGSSQNSKWCFDPNCTLLSYYRDRKTYKKELSPWSPDFAAIITKTGWKNSAYLVWRTGGFSLTWSKLSKLYMRLIRVDRRVWFEFVEDRGERVTRLSVDPLNIKSKLSNTELRRRFFSNRVVQQWNDLPKEIKNAKSGWLLKKPIHTVETPPVWGLKRRKLIEMSLPDWKIQDFK